MKLFYHKTEKLYFCNEYHSLLKNIGKRSDFTPRKKIKSTTFTLRRLLSLFSSFFKRKIF